MSLCYYCEEERLEDHEMWSEDQNASFTLGNGNRVHFCNTECLESFKRTCCLNCGGHEMHEMHNHAVCRTCGWLSLGT